MQRRVRWLALALAALLGAAWAQDSATGTEGAAAVDTVAADSLATNTLPVTRVVLFTNGVGYFEHSGVVTGTEERELRVAADQMDDLLQSLVLQDFDGGSIAPVRYPSSDPLPRVLASYTLDLSGDPTLAELLAQARGEALHLTAGEPLDGVLVNVESVPQPDGAAPRTFLTLSTARGLERIPLDEVRDLRFAREAVQRDLEGALAAIRSFRDGDARPVRLRFEGEGERRVRVGYVREMPVWKTSYRMVLGSDGRATLQGWAIADNPTDLDLTDVEMAFVAGQPIAFVTDLYAPVYVARPHVSVSTAPSVVPRADSGAAAPQAMESARAAPSAALSDAVAGAAMAAAPKLEGAGVEAMAQGVELGATFAYQVAGTVTIPRHQSAMIPIVQRSVPAHAIAWFDPTVLPTHPLTGVRLENDTGLHLAAGPVTVYDDAGFAGNARLNDLVPGDSRLLGYAVDLGVTVGVERASAPERVVAVALRGGTLETQVRQRLTTRYRIDTEGPAARYLVVEHRTRDGFDVTGPAPAPARTADGVRFGVALAGADGSEAAADPDVPRQLGCDRATPCVLQVVEERTDRRTVAVRNVAPDQIAFYLENVELSDADRATLSRVQALQQRLAELGRSMADIQSRIDGIHQEQGRIRQNMGALDRTSTLYRRYVSELESQENTLADLQAQLSDLRDARAQAQSALDDLVAGLEAGSAP